MAARELRYKYILPARLPYFEPGGTHRVDDLIRDRGTALLAERGGEPARDYRMIALDQFANQFRGIANPGQHDTGLDRISSEEATGNPDQCGLRREQSQSRAVMSAPGAGIRGTFKS